MNKSSNFGGSALLYAVRSVDLRCVRALLTAGADLMLDQCPVWVPIPSVWCADLYHVGTVCRGFHIACISECRICAFLRVYNELCAHS